MEKSLKSAQTTHDTLPMIDTPVWALEGFVEPQGRLQRVPIVTVPFRVGRRTGLPLTLNSQAVSKDHAEVLILDDRCFLRDLGSTNGTFLNGIPVKGDVPLGSHDIIQFADLEFRLVPLESKHEATVTSHTLEVSCSLTAFERLLSDRGVIPYYQPLIKLATRRVVGYEVLARSEVPGFENPREMFLAAERFRQQTRLSILCREIGLHTSRRLPGKPMIFVNTHPREHLHDDILASLDTLLPQVEGAKVVIEIHEGVVSSSETMKEFHQQLRDRGVQLAYDDFGAGQSRLLELTQAPPEYLKFDISLIRNIHEATPHQQKMVRTLVEIALDCGTIPLAEGIECAAEALVCEQMGFQMAQGFYFGKPAPVSAYLKSDSALRPGSESGLLG